MRRLRQILLAAIILAQLPAEEVSAEPKIASAVIHYGVSLRVPKNAWAYFVYTLDNPDTEPAEVRLVLTPVDQHNMTIYEHTVTLLPGTRYQWRTLVTIGSVEEYEAKIFMGGNELESKTAACRLTMEKDRIVMFMNDDADTSSGSFHKNEDLDADYLNAFTRAFESPTHWAAYDRVHMLVMVRPDYQAMSARQVMAVRDFVARGGTLLFTDPMGVMEAYDSPLQDLLPVTPLRVRPEDTVTAMQEIGGNLLEWEEGTPFLESVAVGDGITTLYHHDYPLVRWRRFGLGRVAVCALNTSQKALHDPDSFSAIWRHLLSHAGRLEYVSSRPSGDVSKALDSLTGIKIPAPNEIRGLLMGYMVLITVLVVVGMVSKRRLAMWGVVAVGALIMTGFVFNYSAGRMKDVSQHAAAILEFTARTEEPTAERIVSLFSKEEQNVDVVGNSADLSLRNLLPPKKKKGTTRSSTRSRPTKSPDKMTPQERQRLRENKRRDEVLRDPLNVYNRDGGATLQGMALRQFAPRTHSELTRGDKRIDLGDGGPTVRWAADGPTLTEPWVPVAELQSASHAAIICESGTIPLILSNGAYIVDPAAKNAAPLPPDLAALTACMTDMRVPAPVLAMFLPIEADELGTLPDQFAVSGRRIEWIPLTQDLKGTVHIPPERMTLDKSGTTANFLQFDPAGYPTTQRTKERRFEIRLVPPGEFSRMKPTAVAVEFIADNRGRNLDFNLALRPLTAAKDDDSKDILASRKEGDTYYFDNLENNSTCFDPGNGKFRLIIISTQRELIKDQESVQRVNAWVISRFNVSVTGELPPAHEGRL
jgi:hypothetical protein